ncbi:TonB-dependent siderophore receptor [Flavivirga sp. 57AJ16]|uniref:TonB-dependent receptor plug domain-containing protein n=1 Tax=Flavivirga sp. 57AJ16 TaxID=3025307 RepID=UPI0023656FB4|nr:TonB-dependent receptor [Flavivirga sp. 57AJ16]MDD7884894.1 TonB-dependent receptor [Flavivirga sp. 57AJ16]
MNKKMNVFGILCFGVSLIGFAQQEQDSTKLKTLDEVVVTDSRFRLKRENSGKSIIKISKVDIERNQGRTVSELINAQSGIEINGSRSNAGQNLGVYVRGGNNRQVLVLIDGIQVSDPSQINIEYDFRLLNLSQIESIEIIKGATSTLYGSGAASAVVNITTKKADTKKVSAVFTSILGTNQSESDQNYNIADFNNSAAVSGTLNKFTYRAAFSNQFSDGLSAAISDTNEKDAYSKYDVDVNLGYKFSHAFSLNVYGNLTNTKSDIDGYDANFNLVDTFDEFNSEQSRAGLSSKYKYKNGSVNVNAAFSEYDREFISSSTFKSKNYVLDAYNKYVFNKMFYTIVGLNVIENKAYFSEKVSFTNIDPYANFVYVSDFGLNVNAGGRLNNHSEYGSHFIYNLNPSFTIKSNDNGYTKVFGSFSTSFITPSLSQLFGSFGPNPDLEPEENRTIEAGVEFKLNNNFRMTGLFFNREEKNTVLWINGGYLNATDKLNARGVEVEVSTTPLEKLSITANYAFTEYKESLARRIPKHKGNLQLGYDFSKKTFASLSYQYTHDRFESSFVPLLDSFSLFNLYVSHITLKNKIKLFGGIDNILNEDYQDVPGYVSKGRNVRLGFQLNL